MPDDSIMRDIVLQSSLRNNFRAQLVVPVAIALLVMIISAIAFTVLTQKKSSNALNEQFKTSFSEIESSIVDDLGGLSRQLDNNLQRMRQEVSTLLAEESSNALQETANNVQDNIRAVRQQSGDNMIQLMEPNIINNDLQTVVNNIQKEISKRSAGTVDDISDRSNNLSSRTRNLFIFGAIIGFILVLGILFLNARSILKLLGGEPASMVQPLPPQQNSNL